MGLPNGVHLAAGMELLGGEGADRLEKSIAAARAHDAHEPLLDERVTLVERRAAGRLGDFEGDADGRQHLRRRGDGGEGDESGAFVSCLLHARQRCPSRKGRRGLLREVERDVPGRLKPMVPVLLQAMLDDVVQSGRHVAHRSHDRSGLCMT